MNTFTPPGLPAYQAQQAQLAAQGSGGFGFGDFVGGLFEIGRDVGASIMQLELYERNAKTQAEIARIYAAGGVNPPTAANPTPAVQTKPFTLGNALSDPIVLAALAIGVILLVLAFRKRA